MKNYNEVINIIKKTFDYDLMCSSVEKYLKSSDNYFWDHYLNREEEQDYIYSFHQNTVSMIFLLADKLPKSYPNTEKYLNRKMYIIENYLKKLDLISKSGKVDTLEFGLGFAFFMQRNLFKEEIIQITFATFFLKKIFLFDQKIFQENLKKRFPNKKQLLQYGVKRYMISYIRKYDIYLADYIEIHISLLSKEILEKINIDKLYQEDSVAKKLKLELVYKKQ